MACEGCSSRVETVLQDVAARYALVDMNKDMWSSREVEKSGGGSS